MKKHLLYVIGDPGSGKSTALAHLPRRCPSQVFNDNTVKKWVSYTWYNDRVCQLGYTRSGFKHRGSSTQAKGQEFGGNVSGTDAINLCGQKLMIEWILEECPYRFLLAEGDRLCNSKFFTAMVEGGVDLTVATILVQPKELERRRGKRAAETGRQQNEQWLRGRSTKVVSLWTEWGTDEWTLDSTHLEPRDVSRWLAKHPVGKEFVKIRRGASA